MKREPLLAAAAVGTSPYLEPAHGEVVNREQRRAVPETHPMFLVKDL